MKIYNKSVIGASHIESGLPCQDYSISQSFEKGSIVVVSDGHGGDTYVRSQVGSKIACEIALAETQKFVLANYELLKSKGVKPITYSPDNGDTQESLFFDLFTAIHDKWYNAIVEDSQKRAFTDEENFKLGKADIKKAYGCTLLVAVKTIDFTFIYQLGDGRIFTITPFNRRWQQPVPWDSQCEDNITTSLCNNNPIERFRYYLNSNQDQPFAVFLCSDGIEDCFEGQHNAMFESEKLEVEYTEILSDFLQKEKFDEICDEFLSNESALGSKDDMSVAFIIDDIYNIQDKWISLNRLYRGAFVLKSEHDTYKAIIDQNHKRLATLTKNISLLTNEISTIKKDIETKTNKLRDLQQEKSEIESRPLVCDSFLELIGNLFETIKIWCNQYGNNKSLSSPKFHESLRNNLESAISSLKSKIEEIQRQIPVKISAIEKEIEKINTGLAQLNSKKERYDADLLRHQNKKAEIEKENKKYESLKQDRGRALESYKKSNTEKLKRIIEEIKKSMGKEAIPVGNPVEENMRYVGRSWNIAKSPEEYIDITVYNNNVQLVLTNKDGVNNHSIPTEQFKDLYARIEKLFNVDGFSNEPCEKYVTIITTNDRGELITIELGSNATMIWDECIELIKMQQ